MLEDYLGWKYVFHFGIGLFLLWALIIAFIGFGQKKQKDKNKSPLKKKWWYWVISIILGAHMMFVQFINPTYFGLGTPEYFSEIYVQDDRIILFDEDVSYFDDDNFRTDDYTGHLRIHLIDRNAHTKIYSHLIGNNYSTYVVGSTFYLVSNSQYFNYSDDNLIYSISEFDLESKNITPIVEADGEIKVDSKSISVFTIYISGEVFVKSDQGEVYRYNTNTKSFDWFDGSSTIQYVPPTDRFDLRASVNSNDRMELSIDDSLTEHSFLLGQIEKQYESEYKDRAYVMIRSFNDLNKTSFKLTLVNDDGALMWDADLALFEKEMNISNLSDVHNIHFHEDYCYLTIDAYLLELDHSHPKVF
ncbi:hypothetical protein JYT74_00745 [Crocinitomix catalasitica]|nr:hypothetical protein [Crocinitomix catalasitica]